MPYVSDDKLLEDFPKLDFLYMEAIKQPLDPNLQPSSIACFFGAKNIDLRRPQITFLESIFASQVTKLRTDLVFADGKQMQNHIEGLRIITAASLFIKEEIRKENIVLKSGSDLNKVLDKLLALDKNPMDPDSELSCYLEAQKYVALTASFHLVYWEKFKLFLDKRCQTMNVGTQNPYPVTNKIMPIFSTLFKSIGRESGQRFAEACRRSEPLLSDARYSITAAITSSLYFVIRPGRLGLSLVLLAPTLAEIITHTVCTRTIAFLIENVISLSGQGAVFSITMTIDMILKILFHATQLLGQILEASKERPRLSGFTLTDGQRIVNGMLFRHNSAEDAPPPYDALNAHDELAFEIEPSGLSLKHGKGPEADSCHLPWAGPINAATIEAELAKFEELQDKREYEVLPSAPPLIMEM